MPSRSRKRTRKQPVELRKVQQCTGITKRRGMNVRCSHTTAKGSLCWQHMRANKGLTIKKLGKSYRLFTKQLIPEGGIIAPLSGNKIKRNLPDELEGNPFVRQVKSDPLIFVDARESTSGEARFARRDAHHSNSILKYRSKTGKTELIALRDIGQNEEIICDPREKPKSKRVLYQRDDDGSKRRVKIAQQPAGSKKDADSDVAPPRKRLRISEAPHPVVRMRRPRVPVQENFKGEKKHERGIITRLLVINKWTQSEKVQKALNIPAAFPFKLAKIPKRGDTPPDKWHSRLEKQLITQEKQLLAWVRTSPGAKITAAMNQKTLEAYEKKTKTKVDPTEYY